jgi:hypothetical protein
MVDINSSSYIENNTMKNKKISQRRNISNITTSEYFKYHNVGMFQISQRRNVSQIIYIEKSQKETTRHLLHTKT